MGHRIVMKIITFDSVKSQKYQIHVLSFPKVSNRLFTSLTFGHRVVHKGIEFVLFLFSRS